MRISTIILDTPIRLPRLENSSLAKYLKWYHMLSGKNGDTPEL